jgi:hypothetical protein
MMGPRAGSQARVEQAVDGIDDQVGCNHTDRN